VQRLPGPSFVPLVAALTLGSFFIFGTFHVWWLAMASLVVATGVVVRWLWTATGIHPEKPDKDVGLGLRLPLYASGSASVGWWGLFVTMLAVFTAYVCLVFGYFFFWTIHEDFPPDPSPGPGVFWPVLGGALVAASYGLTLLARRWNRGDRLVAVVLGLAAAVVLDLAGAAALLAGPSRTALDPTAHAYGAIVWLLVLWTVLHVALGLIMQVYCVARRAAEKLTARHDADLENVVLYWHFAALTTLVTVLVIAGFPLVS
jgi:cytochrome c oxidase subunit I+III